MVFKQGSFGRSVTQLPETQCESLSRISFVALARTYLSKISHDTDVSIFQVGDGMERYRQSRVVSGEGLSFDSGLYTQVERFSKLHAWPSRDSVRKGDKAWPSKAYLPHTLPLPLASNRQ